MTLVEQLQNKTAEERATLKAQWFSQLPTKTFTRGQFTVTLSDFKAEGGVFSVFVVVLKNGVEVLRDEFRFVNPPILVPDGTTHIEQMTLPNGDIKDIEMPNYREDIVESFKTILIDAIKKKIV